MHTDKDQFQPVSIRKKTTRVAVVNSLNETMMLPGSVYSIDQDHVLVVSWMEVHKQSSLPAATRWMI